MEVGLTLNRAGIDGGSTVDGSRRVTELNPVNGSYWLRLADAARAGGLFESAVEAYRKAIDLGVGYPAEVAYKIALCFGRLRDRDSTLEWLETARSAGYRHVYDAATAPELEFLRSDADLLAAIGLFDPSGLSRNEGWTRDLEVFERDVRRKSHHVSTAITLDAWHAAVQDVAVKVDSLTDSELILELTRLATLLGDGHSRVEPPPDNATFNRGLPLELQLFDEGLFVVAARPDLVSLLGAQVLDFEGKSIAAMIDALAPTSRVTISNG